MLRRVAHTRVAYNNQAHYADQLARAHANTNGGQLIDQL